MSQKKRIRRPKLTLEQVAQEFKKAGDKLLSKEYLGTKQLLQYQCKCGRICTTVYNNYSRGADGCPACDLNRRFPKRRQNQEKQSLRIKLRSGLFNMSDVAKILGVDYSDFRNHVKTLRVLPEPSRACGVRKYYSAEDVDQLAQMIVLE